MKNRAIDGKSFILGATLSLILIFATAMIPQMKNTSIEQQDSSVLRSTADMRVDRLWAEVEARLNVVDQKLQLIIEKEDALQKQINQMWGALGHKLDRYHKKENQ